MPDRARAIRIDVEADTLSRWVLWLAEALARRPGTSVSVRVVEGDEKTPSLDALLSLEGLLVNPGRKLSSDRIGRDELGRFLGGAATPADTVIDLTAQKATYVASQTVLRPLYNGHAGETALTGALFFEGTPRITVERSREGQSRIAASGTASLEAASGIGGKIEAVASRVITLILKALDQPDSLTAASSPMTGAVRTIGRGDLLRYSARAVANKAIRVAYELCCHPSHWRVGWRFVAPGADVWSRRDLGGTRWNVLADPVDHFYADPFPWTFGGKDYLFFEDLDYKSGKGVIAVVAFGEDGRPGQPVTVLEEAWHLSYPFLIERDGQIFMIPESSANRDVAVYRAVEFPFRWERHAVLLQDIEAADATLVERYGRWWMFAVTRDGIGGYSDTLALWSSDDLFGQWRPHPRNPVLVDDRTARPAGNMVEKSGVLYRPVQDCRAAYGAALKLARVTRLDDDRFAQEVETTLNAGADWPGRRIHTLNYNGRLETVDGFVLRPKLKFAADIVDRRFAPKA